MVAEKKKKGPGEVGGRHGDGTPSIHIRVDEGIAELLRFHYARTGEYPSRLVRRLLAGFFGAGENTPVPSERG